MHIDLARREHRSHVAQHADAAARGDLQAGREPVRAVGDHKILVPPGVQPAVGVLLHMHVDAVAPVDGYAVAARDKAHDLVARNGRAAARELDQTVVDALDHHAGRALGDALVRLLGLRVRGALGLLALAAQLAHVVLDLVDDLGQRDAAVADGGVQFVQRTKRELVERVFLHFLVLVKAVVQQVGAQLAVQILAAVDDVLLAALLLEPLLDLVARLGRFDDLDPVAARAVRLLGGQDLDDVAVFELAVDRRDAAVDLAAGHAVADRRVDGVGEVDRGRARGHVDHIALGREHEHLVREQVDLDILDEVLSLGVLLRFEQLTDPRKGLLVALFVQPLFVLPVRRNAVFRHLVHLGGADLDLKRDARAADDRRVQRLVAVGLGCGDIVLEAARDGLIQVVHIAEHVVAVRNRVHDHTHRADVVDLVDRLVLGVHLAVDRVDVLDARGDRVFDVRFLELGADALLNALEELLVLFALGFQALDDLVVADRVEHFEAQVLEFPLDAAHAQTVRDGRIDLHRLERLVALFSLGQVLEGARVVQAVGQLDQDDADVLGHCHEHLAQVLKLLLLLGIAQHAQAGDAVHQLGDRRAEFVFNLLIAELGVLDAVMQQRRADRIRIQPHLDHDLGYRDRVDDIRLAVFALLPLVRRCGALIGRTDLPDIGLRVLLLHALEQKIQFVLHTSFPHSDHPAILCSVARTTEPDISALPS